MKLREFGVMPLTWYWEPVSFCITAALRSAILPHNIIVMCCLMSQIGWQKGPFQHGMKFLKLWTTVSLSSLWVDHFRYLLQQWKLTNTAGIPLIFALKEVICHCTIVFPLFRRYNSTKMILTLMYLYALRYRFHRLVSLVVFRNLRSFAWFFFL